MGLTNYELWYSDLPNEMRLGNLEETCLHLESDIVKNNSSEDTYNLKEEDAASIYETFSNLHYHSETSVMNDKYTDANVNQRLDVEVYRAKPIEQNKKFQSQDFYMNSAESSGETDGSMQDDYDQFHCSSPYNIHSEFILVSLFCFPDLYPLSIFFLHRSCFGCVFFILG